MRFFHKVAYLVPPKDDLWKVAIPFRVSAVFPRASRRYRLWWEFGVAIPFRVSAVFPRRCPGVVRYGEEGRNPFQGECGFSTSGRGLSRGLGQSGRNPFQGECGFSTTILTGTGLWRGAFGRNPFQGECGFSTLDSDLDLDFDDISRNPFQGECGFSTFRWISRLWRRAMMQVAIPFRVSAVFPLRTLGGSPLAAPEAQPREPPKGRSFSPQKV